MRVPLERSIFLVSFQIIFSLLGLVSLPHLPGHPLPAELRPHYVGLNRLPFNYTALSVKNYYSDGFGLGGVLCSVYWNDPFSRVLFFANNYSALRDAGGNCGRFMIKADGGRLAT